MTLPYRLDLAGGWMDQPFVSKHCSGSVVVISLEPTHEFNCRSGMATSTRKAAQELWGDDIPTDQLVKTAKILFAYENPPGKQEIAGSQDAIGLVYPGCHELIYYSGYWPQLIESLGGDDILDWLEPLIWLVPLRERPKYYNVFKHTDVTPRKAERLAVAADKCAIAIRNKNLEGLKEQVTKSFEAQIAMFPNMVSHQIVHKMCRYVKDGGVKLSGAGGGGYIVVISEKQPASYSLPVKIRRK